MTSLTRHKAAQKVIRLVGEVLTEQTPREALLERIAQSVFTWWHIAFISKSVGGMDEFGNVWPPLKPETVRAKIRNRSAGIEKDRQAQWQERQSRYVGELRAAGFNARQAKAKAADLAWQSYSQRSDIYSTATLAGVPINVDTTRLEVSLDPYADSEDRVQEFDGDTIRLGSSVPYGVYVNAARRFLPTQEEAAVFVERAAVAAADEVADYVRENL